VTDEKNARRGESHAERVRDAFDSFLTRHGERLDPHGHRLLEEMRQAASQKDQDRLRRQLMEARERHGWLYRELAAHPSIATLLDELALWGL
jgi:hypothetical protein